MALGDINAMANINQQTRNQRTAFSGDNTTLGANVSAHLLFANKLSLEDSTGEISIEGKMINDSANDTLQKSYRLGVTGNPDFPGQYKNLDYRGSEAMLESVENMSDKPNALGPNLLVPEIDNNGETSTIVAIETLGSPVTGRGFGVNLDRHEPGKNLTLGNYLARRRDEEEEIQVPKGEYVNEEKYNWEA